MWWYNLESIFSQCRYFFLEMKVLIAALAAVLLFVIALSHSQVLPEPTEEQIQCFTNGAQAQATELVRICGDFLSLM